MNEEIEYFLKIAEMKWTNIQHHERLRINLFSIYLVMVGSFFVILQLQGNQIYNKALGLFAAITIQFVGLLFIYSVNHFRSLISRDIKTVHNIYDILCKKNDEIRTIFTDFNKYYEIANNKQNTALFVMGNTLILCTSLISSSILSAAFWIYLLLSLCEIALIFIVLIILHLLVSCIIWNCIVVRINS